MPSTAPASFRVGRVVRSAARAAIFAVGAFFALLLGIRLVVYPQLEAHRADIARWLGTKIGASVEIDDIVTGWQGWNPRLSIRGFRVRERAGSGALLELPRVDLLVAWTSLPRLDLRLKELSIDSPRLAVRRDAQGRLHVGGIEMAQADERDDSAFVGWLLRQPQVVVRDALVTWNDDLRHAPQLLLDHVEFRLEQHLGHHRAGLTGVPPPELAGPIDLRADLTGLSRKDFSHASGRIYFRLDYADVAAWREWLPLPFAIASGRGALRAWADVAAGEANAVVADLELADVRVTLADNLAPLALAHVAGRAEWKHASARTTFRGTQLTLALPDGERVGPTDLAVTTDAATAAAPAAGTIAFSAIDLAPLAAIAANLPLPDDARRDIARFAPQGTIRNATISWTGEPAAPARYALTADVSDMTVVAQQGLPGVSRLSASIDMNEHEGHARIDARQATLALPGIFEAPIALDRVRGNVQWQRASGATRVSWTDVAFENDGLAGTSQGAWQSQAEGPGTVDLSAHLTRANLASAHRYLPLSAPVALREWLARAVVKGTSDDARLALAGDLAFFPFGRGSDGRFELDIKARDATLAYADRWPAITDIAADVRIAGSRVVVDAASAQTSGVQVGATHAEIADARDRDATLRVEGTARGATSQFLAFVAQSPVAAWIGHAIDDARVEGDGQLSLQLALPLHQPAGTTVAGDYRFASAAVQLAGMPRITDAAGTLDFTEHDVRGTAITGQMLGGPVMLALAGDGRSVKVEGSGSVDVGLVRDAFDIPVLAHVAGTTDWQLGLDVRDGAVAWTIGSSLAGATVDLPAPIGKQAAATLPLRIVRRAGEAQDDRIDVDYGGIARALLHRSAAGGSRAVDRALVLVGDVAGDTALPQRPGIWVQGAVPAIDVDAWLDANLAAAAQSDGAPTTSALAINGIDLRAASATALGRQFSGVKTTARRASDGWRLVLDANELAGSATWHPATPAEPNGRIAAHLARLRITPPIDAAPQAGSPQASHVHRWPAVELVADVVEKKGRPLGRLELTAQPSGPDWQIRKLALVNEAGRIDAQGWWRNAAARSQTRLDVAIDVREAGGFLGRFGWPDAIRGTPTKIDGQVAWAGAPSDFDYPSLAGRFTLHAGAGQFTKLEPGVGRLLGVLSLQALPRRMSLDFRDLFSQGFSFDSIAGDVRIDRGVMHTDNLRLSGPAAAVDIAGDVDLAHETQDLSVRVQPSLSTGVSAGAAALFIANPLLGAAVGAGALLAQKMLNNPFDQLFSYRYAVSGSFDEPLVTRVNAGDVSTAPSAANVR